MHVGKHYEGKGFKKRQKEVHKIWINTKKNNKTKRTMRGVANITPKNGSI